jgi:hypothetical protein
MRAQSPAVGETPIRPAILGSQEKGKYVNHVIGFELQLDPACTFADESRAIARSTQLPQRLSLALRCGDNVVILSSFPLQADEHVNLRRDAQPSLQGAKADVLVAEGLVVLQWDPDSGDYRYFDARDDPSKRKSPARAN